MSTVTRMPGSNAHIQPHCSSSATQFPRYVIVDGHQKSTKRQATNRDRKSKSGLEYCLIILFIIEATQ